MISSDFQVRLNDPCGRLVAGPGWSRTREHSFKLSDAELWLVWKGRGWMRSRDRQFDLLPGFCALMRPGGIYDARFDEKQPLGFTFIHFSAWRGKNVRECTSNDLYREWPEFFEVPDLDFYDSCLRRIVQLFARQRPIAEALLRATLLDLLHSDPPSTDGTMVTAEQRKNVARLIVSIHATPGRLPRVSEMAQRLHWSPAHFSRIFKLVTQQSPRDFLLELRLSRARHLLRETSLAVGEIAERLDYPDLFYFSRQFKQKSGLSPLQFRHQKRGHLQG
jgi:AraC-like DNA-binding protein